MPNFPTFPTLGMGLYGPVTVGAGVRPKPAVLTARFGGRYSQRTGDGLNSLPRDFDYKSVALTPVRFKILDDFLIGRRGYLPFMFLVPYETTPRQFICKDWQPNYTQAKMVALVASFEENFDP